MLPTLLSAAQLRLRVPIDVADIVIVCFGPVTAYTTLAADICAAGHIQFILVPKAVLNGAAMICARFFLSTILEPTYTEIVYIDGDTQVAGSVEPLLTCHVGSGEILATPDPMAVMIDSPHGSWPARRAYFDSIGVPAARQRSYFNSGVLRFRRGDWEAVSRECLKLCSQRGADLEFRDQDALNIVVGGHHRPISFRWNFPPFFMNFGADVAIAPRIYHFMSNPRPWQGPFAPWGRVWHEPYLAFAAAHPGLARSMGRIGSMHRMKYVAQQRYKRFVESKVWGTPEVQRRIYGMEACAVV